MSIKTKIKLILGLVLLATILFGVFILSLLQRHQEALNKEAIANRIVLEVFERRFLADQYIGSQSDRTKDQWFAKQADLEGTFKAYEATSQASQEKILIAQMRKNLSASKDVFENLVAVYESGSLMPDGNLNQEKLNILSGQLTIEAQKTISTAASFQQINDSYAAKSLDQIVLLFFTTGGVFLLLLLASFREIWHISNQSEKKKAETEAILRGIGEAVCAINTQKRIVLFNWMASQISGYTEESALGKSYSSVLRLVNHKADKASKGFIESALKGRQTHTAKEAEMLTRSGQTIPVAYSAAPVLNSQGEVYGAVVVFRDITREKETERAKDEFISIASHQLRTPATGVKQYLGMLLNEFAGKLNEQQEKLLRYAYESNERQIEIVNDLLQVARIDAGQIKFRKKPKNIMELLRDVIKEQNERLTAKQQVLSFNSPRKKIMAHVDASRMRMVLENILDNASKYTPPGKKIKISIYVKKHELQIQVQDQGVGMKQADIAKIFEKFSRLDNPLSAAAGGSGLGLYWAAKIMDLHGGGIDVTSEPDKGSSFIVKLPLKNCLPSLDQQLK